MEKIFFLIIVVFVFIALPVFLIWLIWKKTSLLRRKKWLMTAAIAATFLFILNSYNLQESKIVNNHVWQGNKTVKVLRVIDGDTIELSDGRRIRYIGMDTPELAHKGNLEECFGREAAEANKNLVEGREVKLKKDVSETDKYNRLLRYVYVDDIFVNEYLVENGFAKALYIKPDTKFYNQFKELEANAKENNRGMWKFCY